MAALQFAPFTSEVELPFYTSLFASKLDKDMLDDSARPLIGVYGFQNVDPALSTRMQILANAMSGQAAPANCARADGIIRNVNTLDDFKNMDKSAMIQTAGKQIWDAIRDGTIYSVPSLLASFALLSFTDLKRYRVAYWFAFPALHSDPVWTRVGDVGRIGPFENELLVGAYGTWRYSQDPRQHGFFLAKRLPPTDPGAKGPSFQSRRTPPRRWAVESLGSFETGFFSGVADIDRFVCFVDPSNYPDSPSWPLRNLLVLIRQRFHLAKVRVICFRDTHSSRHEARNIILDLELPELTAAAAPIAPDAPAADRSRSRFPDTHPLELTKMPRVTGWERNVARKLTHKNVNLSEYMDPAHLADQSVDLNLKLMKWRLAPELDLPLIRNTRCLLLGAGTLGGYVARNLMAWGVRKITFVDYGTVSYSNPVRQPLFEFAHCQGGGDPKAERAAQSLRDIYPNVESAGFRLEVPMLGHAFASAAEARTRADFEKLRDLVAEHDAIFLLMDTREARWLPAVMGKVEDKIVMNAALGFDSYLAMRHGAETEKGEVGLGCYFCNDVVAPADSMKAQTLDQQCTVTRPGVAAIASATLVEMLASLLQHPLRHRAPAASSAAAEPDPPEHPLGLVPHQIRGSVGTFSSVMLRGESYSCCSACGPAVLAAYRADGWGFVRRALMEKHYVAEISGLTEVQRQAEAAMASVEWEEDEGGEDEVDSGREDGDGELI